MWPAGLRFDTFCSNSEKVCFHFLSDPFLFFKLTTRAALALLHTAPDWWIWDTRSLTSGAPSHFLAHILILLTNFSPSGGSSTPPRFLLFLRLLTNPTQADSGTKIQRAWKRQLERLHFRSRRRRQNFLDRSVSRDPMRRERAPFEQKPGACL